MMSYQDLLNLFEIFLIHFQVDLLVSWNFKHIVNIERIHGV